MDERYAQNLQQFTDLLSVIAHIDVFIVLLTVIMLAGVAFSTGVMVGRYKERERYKRHKHFIERIRKDAKVSNND